MDRRFMFMKIFWAQRVVCPCPGAIYMCMTIIFKLGMSTNAEIGIRIFAYDIRIYSNIRMIYTSMSNRPITMTYWVVHVLKI